MALVAGTMLCPADWVLVEDPGFLGGVGTDPNSMVPDSRVGRDRLFSLSSGRHLPRTGALTVRFQFRSALSSWGGDSYPERGGGGSGVGASLGPQLAEDGFDMVVDCLYGDHEPVGDLAVLQTLVH